MSQSKDKQGDNVSLKSTFTTRRLRVWFFSLIFLAGLILFVTHFSELEHFAQLLRQIKPLWLIAGFLLPSITYLSAAAVWHQTLRYAGVRYSLWSLVPLSIAKLFSDQALPTGGMSGTIFLVASLNRRGITKPLCLAILMVSMTAYYMAYLLAALGSISLLWFYHDLPVWIIAVAVVFCIVAVAISAGTLWLRRRGRQSFPGMLMRIPGVSVLLNALGDAPGYLLKSPELFIKTILLQGTIFLLDAYTLNIMLYAIGQDVSFLVVYPSFVVASMVATLGPVPLGLGTFEATCVAVLSMFDIRLEAALTATLLLRGFTLWLPMFPGLWLAKRELR
ncbi:MAG: flippase-like domain-containing protein [Planctomycetia bacterium]|nr:flippase-like domain-containing protein [Planctomycetia bacterium]